MEPLLHWLSGVSSQNELLLLYFIVAVRCMFVCVEFNGHEQINRMVSHPTLPLTITAHEDRHLRFFDNNTGVLFLCMIV